MTMASTFDSWSTILDHVGRRGCRMLWPWVTIAHSVVFKPLRKEVVDFRIDTFGGRVFYGVDIKE